MTPPTDSDFASLKQRQQADIDAVRAELAAYRAEVASRNAHGLTEKQLILLGVVLKWAEWLADGGKLLKSLLGVVVFFAMAFTAGKTLWDGIWK